MDFSTHPMFEWLQDLRRDFHRQPETAFQEFATTRKIMDTFRGLGLGIRKLDGQETGAVGLLEGVPGKRVLGLRADIDALPIQEENDVAYRSQNDGSMHACGHDAHTTIMLGVAKKLVDSGAAKKLRGRVKFVFQPAEESVKGAKAMIDAGVLQDPAMDRILACHMWNEGDVGQVGLYKGPSHAATDRFDLVIHGKGAHGARPHKSIDPIVAGAHFVTALQTIASRNINPVDAAVVTVGKFIGGTAANIIPERAELRGTLRSFTDEVRDLAMRRIEEIVAGLRTTFRVETEYEFIQGVPACTNNETVSQALKAAAIDVVGEKNVHFIERDTGGEDFGLFTRVIPGALMRLGCMNPAKGIIHPTHSPHFDIDESVLPIGVEIITRAVTDYLV